MSMLLGIDTFAKRLRHGQKTTLLDCTWVPGDGASHAHYLTGHIPTALHCNPQFDLATGPSPTRGRNPLPTVDTLNRAFRKWGLNLQHRVVVYDSGRGLMAARAWWVLTWAGVPEVQILEGGLAAWENAGHRPVGGPGNLACACTLAPKPGQLPTITIDEVKELGSDILIIDTREHNRYAGRKERLDLKAGHIPGAVNVPLESLTDEHHIFHSPEKLRQVFLEAGVTDPKKVVVYSGSGLHSAAAIAAMHVAGLPGAAHYVGGWSQWCADPKNPVERLI